MSFEQRVEPHHKLMFQDAFEVAIQQQLSKYRPHVTEKMCAGEGANAADVFGTLEMEEIESRRADNPDNPPNRSRRWLVLRNEAIAGFYLDKLDKWRQIDDPTSELMATLTAAARRYVDRKIMGMNKAGEIAEGGVLGTVFEGGIAPSAEIAFPTSAAYTTAHGGTGLTLAKLRAARLELAKHDNDLDMASPVCAITPQQHDDLLAYIDEGSFTFKGFEEPQFREGKVARVMGINLIESNIVPKVSAVRSCPVWMPQNIIMGLWEDVTTKLLNDSSKRDVPHASIFCTLDVTRKQDKGVHVIQCQES